MVLILDTTIFIRGATFFEEGHEKADSIIQNDEWFTSERVINELREVKDRRFEIYTKIYSIKPTIGGTFRDIYKRGFKSTCSGYYNDLAHVTNIFNFALKKCDLNYDDDIDEEKLNRFQHCMYPIMRPIKVRFGKIIYNFENPDFCSKHLTMKVLTTTKCKDMKKELMKKLNKSVAHKDDVKILINAILHGYYIHERVTFLSTHGFFVNDTNKGIVRDTINKFYPDHPGFEIKGLDNIE